MRQFYTTLLLLSFATLGTQSAFGYVEFHKAWVKMYIDADDESEETAEYKKLVAKGRNRCLVCHQGRKKSNRNTYGELFVDKLGKKDKKDSEKIIEVLTEVGKLPVDPEADPDDEETLTYNDVIAKKEFPGGKLEDLQAEPPKEEETEGE